MSIDVSELKKGLAAARPYVLSHHEPAEWYRCYAPVVFGRRVRLCARCTGIYPGIVAGLLGYFGVATVVPVFLLVAVLPLPALLDWTLTTFTGHRGYNGVRTATGLLLGFGYGLGVRHLLAELDLRLVALGLVYGIVAGTLLYTDER